MQPINFSSNNIVYNELQNMFRQSSVVQQYYIVDGVTYSSDEIYSMSFGGSEKVQWVQVNKDGMEYIQTKSQSTDGSYLTDMTEDRYVDKTNSNSAFERTTIYSDPDTDKLIDNVFYAITKQDQGIVKNGEDIVFCSQTTSNHDNMTNVSYDYNYDGKYDYEAWVDNDGNIIHEYIDSNYNGTGITREIDRNGNVKIVEDNRNIFEKIADVFIELFK